MIIQLEATEVGHWAKTFQVATSGKDKPDPQQPPQPQHTWQPQQFNRPLQLEQPQQSQQQPLAPEVVTMLTQWQAP